MTATNLTHKEMTAHIRNRIKVAKIPANVRMFNYCGVKAIKIYGKTFDTLFTAEQCLMIAQIAKSNRLTKAQGSEINLAIEVQLTGNNEKHFEFHG